MSSKRKSPPTKLDGSNGISDTKYSMQDVDVIPSAEIDLSIKSSPHHLADPETSRISPDVRHLDANSEINRHNQLNGSERLSGTVKRRGGNIQVRVWVCPVNIPLANLLHYSHYRKPTSTKTTPSPPFPTPCRISSRSVGKVKTLTTCHRYIRH